MSCGSLPGRAWRLFFLVFFVLLQAIAMVACSGGTKVGNSIKSLKIQVAIEKGLGGEAYVLAGKQVGI